MDSRLFVRVKLIIVFLIVFPIALIVVVPLVDNMIELRHHLRQHPLHLIDIGLDVMYTESNVA